MIKIIKEYRNTTDGHHKYYIEVLQNNIIKVYMFNNYVSLYNFKECISNINDRHNAPGLSTDDINKLTKAHD